MIDLSVQAILNDVAKVVTGATIARIGLHWSKEPLGIWISPASAFWSFYGKLELTLSYVSGSLAAFGRKTALSTAEAPVTLAASKEEGKIQ